MTACLPEGEQRGPAPHNNRLRPEKIPWNCFRTGVRLPSPPPDVRYTNTITKASLAVYGTWFALVVNTDDYEGEFYPETKVPTYQEIRAWIKKKYGFNVNSASISQTKRKYGLIADSGDTERRYIQKVKPEKEAAIREALVWFGIIKGK